MLLLSWSVWFHMGQIRTGANSEWPAKLLSTQIKLHSYRPSSSESDVRENASLQSVNSMRRQAKQKQIPAWWSHQMETFSASLALCAGNSPVTGEFPTQRPVTRNFDVFFDMHLNKRLSKQWRRRWFETPSHSLWRHYNMYNLNQNVVMFIPKRDLKMSSAKTVAILSRPQCEMKNQSMATIFLWQRNV